MYAVTGICRYLESDSVQSYRNPTDCMKFDKVLRRTEGVELITFNLLQVEKHSASGDTRTYDLRYVILICNAH